MNGFISRLVSNHTNPTRNVMPRLKGTFETFPSFQQTSPDSFGEEHIEGRISNQYNSLNQNKSPDANLHTAKTQKEIVPGKENSESNSIIDYSEENQQTVKPVNIRPGISNVENPQQNWQEHETNLKAVTTRLDLAAINDDTGTSFINNDFKKNIKVNESDELNQNEIPGKSTNENFTETIENYLLIPNMKNAAGNFNSQQYIPDDQQSDAENSLPQQTPANRKQQLNMAIVNAFRLIQNENAAAKNTGEDSTQVIKVNIGRIDVRAVTQQTPPAREAVRPKHAMSLDDFLKKKNNSK